MHVTGLAMVRLPEDNFDEEGRGVWPAKVVELNGLSYHGTDRMEWFDVDELHSMGQLSDGAEKAHERLVHAYDSAEFGLGNPRICLYEDDLRCMFDDIGDMRSRNEAVAWCLDPNVYNAYGIEIDDSRLEFRGVDVVFDDARSAIYEYVFRSCAGFEDAATLLNQFGLIETHEQAKGVIELYNSAMSAGTIEFIPDQHPINKPTLVDVWSLKL